LLVGNEPQRMLAKGLTYDLCKKLPQDSDQLVIDKLATLERWIFEPLDLLLDDNLKGRGTNE
jgi:hypothetical protein